MDGGGAFFLIFFGFLALVIPTSLSARCATRARIAIRTTSTRPRHALTRCL